MLMVTKKKTKKKKKHLYSSSQPFTCINEVFFFPSTFKFFKTFSNVFLTPQRGDMGKGRAIWQVTEQGALGHLRGGGHLSPLGFQMGQSGHKGSRWALLSACPLLPHSADSLGTPLTKQGLQAGLPPHTCVTRA